MKLSKTKKIILSLVGIGVLTTSIVIPILVVNNDKKNNQIQEKNEKDIKPNVDKLKVNLQSTATLKGSKISNGQHGKIFQDEFGNLWAMGSGSGSKLQVLKANSQKNAYLNEGWTSGNSGLTKNLNIDGVWIEKFFQDSFKNLWAIVSGSKLQVLKANPQKDGYVNEGWINDNSQNGDTLLKNSNITNGEGGTIFQDDFGNLWAVGIRTKLQVLEVNSQKDGYVNLGWTSDNSGLAKNSNINNGWGGKIFQDEFGNLWSMGSGSKLQVLKINPQKNGYVSEGWINDNNKNTGDNLLKNSNITNGQDGIIFQDSFKNLWTMGHSSKLQVLKANSQKDGYVEGWTSDNLGLTKNSNINNGTGGAIFQDNLGNLWSMGSGSKLQVLKINSQKNGYVNAGWINNNNKNTGDNLLKNSNITDGWDGTIFQDEFKNLWTMGKATRLQVLKANPKKDGYLNVGWTSGNSGLTKNSNITNIWNIGGSNIKGSTGTIFQDEFKNLWSMGFASKLQVLKANKNKDGYFYVESWINK